MIAAHLSLELSLNLSLSLWNLGQRRALTTNMEIINVMLDAHLSLALGLSLRNFQQRHMLGDELSFRGGRGLALCGESYATRTIRITYLELCGVASRANEPTCAFLLAADKSNS